MKTTRRGFIQKTGALTAGASASWLASLAAIGEASAQTAPGDYKALVCVFLLGGNDHANTLVPVDAASYQVYSDMRGDLRYEMDTPTIGGTALTLPGVLPLKDLKLPAAAGRQFALAPPLTSLYKYFAGVGGTAADAGKLAVLLNVGPLVEPTVGVVQAGGQIRLRKKNNTSLDAVLPPQLESHNDQVSVWQSSDKEGSTIGWGGRIGDTVGTGNRPAVFTCISASGNALLLTGQGTVPYVVTSGSSNVSVALSPLRESLYGSSVCSQALGQIVTGSGSTGLASHIFERDLVAIAKRSIAADDVLRAIPIPDDAAMQPLKALAQANNGLAAQLRAVAHLIRHRATTGARRQVFYVALGGFDNHSNLAKDHPPLLKRVGDAMAAFQQVIDGLGLANNVTTFTASDFGRTLNSNGDGSDHGWGSMHFVMGGAVNGGQLYGTPPVFRNDTVGLPVDSQVDDRGRGRLIPTTSVDQVAYTLARWMGVPDQAMGTPGFLPSLVNFASNKDLGFMKPA